MLAALALALTLDSGFAVISRPAQSGKDLRIDGHSTLKVQTDIDCACRMSERADRDKIDAAFGDRPIRHVGRLTAPVAGIW